MSRVFGSILLSFIFVINAHADDPPKRRGPLRAGEVPAELPSGGKLKDEPSPTPASDPPVDPLPAPEPARPGRSTTEGPFGIRMGMSLKDISKFSKVTRLGEEPFLYTIEKPPKPHPEFPTVTAMITPECGVSKVAAFGKTEKTSVYGSELQSAFGRLRDALAQKYGKNRIYDYLRAGSIWSEPKDYMMALLKKERTLAAAWSKDYDSDLPDGLKSILLKPSPQSREDWYLVVIYEFTNAEGCSAAIDRTINDAL